MSAKIVVSYQKVLKRVEHVIIEDGHENETFNKYATDPHCPYVCIFEVDGKGNKKKIRSLKKPARCLNETREIRKSNAAWFKTNIG